MESDPLHAYREHIFEDGDLVEVGVRLDDGRVVTRTEDFRSVSSIGDRTVLTSHLYRPDNCTDAIDLARVVSLKLVKRRRDRTEDELNG